MMGKDPVCREEVSEKSAWSSTYQERTYYFNSPECKADFDKDPGRYAAAGAVREAGTRFREKGGRAASRARTKIQSMIAERKNQTADSVGAVSAAFRTASERLREQNQDAVAQYTERAAASVDRIAVYLQQTDAEQMINHAEDFVRRRPGLVIGGALAAGFFAARFLKSSKYAST